MMVVRSMATTSIRRPEAAINSIEYRSDSSRAAREDGSPPCPAYAEAPAAGYTCTATYPHRNEGSGPTGSANPSLALSPT